MAVPTMSRLGAALYEAVSPLAFEDEENAYALAILCQALASPFDDVDELVRDTDDGPGWSSIMDVDRCPEEFLPWLAQLVGVRLTDGSTDAQKRQRIRETDGFKRGTPDAIRGAAREHLSGDQHVSLIERDGSPYRLTVVTRLDEVPESDLGTTWNDTIGDWNSQVGSWDSGTTHSVQNAVLAQKPGGLVLTYLASSGQVWNEASPDWNSAVGTWNDAASSPV